MERQLITDFWVNKISPRMINIAHLIESEDKLPKFSSVKDEIITEIKELEIRLKIFLAVLFIICTFSLSFPSFWGWYPRGLTEFPFSFLLRTYSYFSPEFLTSGATILLILTIILVIIGILLPLPRESVKLSQVSIW